MGQTGSRVVSKLVGSFSFSGSSTFDDPDGVDPGNVIARFGKSPFVLSRRGSMYFDEDGDLAHEFYEEVIPKRKGGHRRMRRVNSRTLQPQGEVKYPFPRLHVDFPIIMYEG